MVVRNLTRWAWLPVTSALLAESTHYKEQGYKLNGMLCTCADAFRAILIREKPGMPGHSIAGQALQELRGERKPKSEEQKRIITN